MTGTFDASGAAAPRRITWTARAIVLGPLGIALLATAAALILGAGADLIGPLWMAAIAWTVLSSLAGALWQGFRHHDWSAFGRYELPDGRDERIDWISRTGRYAHLRDWEDSHLHDDDHLR